MTDEMVDGTETAGTDQALSRALTRALRGTPGVVDVFDAHPVVEAAVTVVAEGLELAEPTGLVDVDRSPGLVSVTAHVATDVAVPTPQTLAGAAAVLRRVVAERGAGGGEVVVSVTARLVEASSEVGPATGSRARA